MADIYHSLSVEQKEPDPFENTALVQKLRATPTAPNGEAEKRELQAVADDILAKLPGARRAVTFKTDETQAEYAAVIGTQLAAFGPAERKDIDRLRLAKDSPAALAEVLREDFEIAKAEIERPRYSLKPGETRAVVKVDRAGHEITEFFNAENRCAWMDDFKPQTISYVSGGSAGFATENRGGVYRFDKGNIVPELIELRRQQEYMESPEYRIKQAYIDAGLEPPSASEIDAMLGKRRA
jgi:hypothetical protein